MAKKLKSFCITTLDGSCELNFFTQAKTNKEALSNLINNSWDFKNIASAKSELTIKIKEIK